ncbi:MAG: hypothetical protein JKY28_00925 [Sulfurimonas sp.]|nr:hypothetical protein [Sulfurimonas sp.]PHQ90575.1 MAG: hypothetical protein COB42_04950 [Sulfurimonas sp.]
MGLIDWKEYKEFKTHTNKEDRLEILVDFMKSYYNINNPREIYSIMKDDDLAQMLLEKKEIKDSEGLENFMYKH